MAFPQCELIKDLKKGNEHLRPILDGKLDEYLREEIINSEGGSFDTEQLHLISRFLKAVSLDPLDTMSRDTPATLPLLHKDLEDIARNYVWNFCSIIGMMNYISGSMREDISMAVHQAAMYSNNSVLTHEQMVIRISRYLVPTRDRGIIFKPDMKKGLELYVCENFARNWKKADHDHPENCL